MKRTPNYDLPNWEKADPIKMDDFNDLTAKLDAALKAADVTLCKLCAPPSETNFGGGLLSGTQSACDAACMAFADAVAEIAASPVER